MPECPESLGLGLSVLRRPWGHERAWSFARLLVREKNRRRVHRYQLLYPIEPIPPPPAALHAHARVSVARKPLAAPFVCDGSAIIFREANVLTSLHT